MRDICGKSPTLWLQHEARIKEERHLFCFLFLLFLKKKSSLPTTSLLSDHSLMSFFFPVLHDARYVSTCRVGGPGHHQKISHWDRWRREHKTGYIHAELIHPRRLLSFGQWRKASPTTTYFIVSQSSELARSKYPVKTDDCTSITGFIIALARDRIGEGWGETYLRVFWSLNNDAGLMFLRISITHPTVFPYTFKLLSPILYSSSSIFALCPRGDLTQYKNMVVWRIRGKYPLIVDTLIILYRLALDSRRSSLMS